MFLKISQRPQENTYVGLYFLKKLQAADRRRVNLIFKDFSQFIITIVIKLGKEQNFKEEGVKKGCLDTSAQHGLLCLRVLFLHVN